MSLSIETVTRLGSGTVTFRPKATFGPPSRVSPDGAWDHGPEPNAKLDSGVGATAVPAEGFCWATSNRWGSVVADTGVKDTRSPAR